MAQITAKKLTKNIFLSMLAQVVSLLTSFILGFIVPKIIDEIEYSHWQVFLLYLGYIGVLHFGLLDGIILRYSQYDYEALDKKRVRSQFQLLFGFTLILCIVTIVFSSCFIKGVNLWLISLLSIGAITKNIFTYTSYTFQITNRISKYALLIVIQRVSYAAVIIGLLIARVNDFYWYCIADLIGDIIGILIGLILNKGLYFGKSLSFSATFKEAWSNISVGIFLLISNFSSMLLVGGAKMVAQWKWDSLTFGKVAFSFSIVNIFLTFVFAVSIVLLPSLKRMKEDTLPHLYSKIRGIISPIMFLILLGYFPLNWFLKIWLPNYQSSLVYLGVLLPIIIFSSKVSLITDNYLKAYRKEKIMLLINVVAIVFGFSIFLFCAYGLKNLDLLLYTVILVVMLRSVISELVVMKIIGKVEITDFIVEFIMTAIFIVAARYCSLWIGCLVYLAALVGYMIVYRKSVMNLMKKVMEKFLKSKKAQ